MVIEARRPGGKKLSTYVDRDDWWNCPRLLGLAAEVPPDAEWSVPQPERKEKK